MKKDRITWTGPSWGLGNRILGLASVMAIAELIDTRVAFSWLNNDHCPCDYSEVFAESPRLIPTPVSELGPPDLPFQEWEPITILARARAALGIAIKTRDFLEQFLLCMRRLPVAPDVVARADAWSARAAGRIQLALHVRRTDRLLDHRSVLRRDRRMAHLRALGLRKSIACLLLPADMLRTYENRFLRASALRFRRSQPAGSAIDYTLYCDSHEELRRTREYLRCLEEHGLRYRAGVVAEAGAWIEDESRRETTMADALAEIVTMSRSSAIVQTDRTSTFSIAASLHGGVPIASAPPHQSFWLEIRRTFGAEAYAV